ncbi:MAG: mechanosensitive ion channel [Paraperlucidibaca sp.]|jgi:small-conductance mechanosensitive channel|uniref:mechanosensitive ion channel family protein n=1 Tax=Paraperlucidibaca sp. TaxID=2708021 RepID=UPI001B56FE51|nr:mechanosensitive ion channel [Paraperlucidibaca sp.]MBQ0722903.1 mechanosensitive ion channel [Paraperlucidibaca sp.]MBQ0841607.1 mechanosensitive ion channel [Paraperlucidibaca sp.]|tara:strand:+ start:1129 stop:2046 length:918 start_codon:yes stop_codon:yes gene_type:complete
MDFLQWLDQVTQLLTHPLLSVGKTDITVSRIIALIGFLVLARVLVAIIDRGLLRLARPDRTVTLSKSGIYALSRIMRYTVWGIVAFMGIDYLGINLSHLALVGGAIGVGIGFGLQNIFSNFISGIVLLLEQTLKVGDFVDLQSGVVGRVSEISIRYTRVTTNDSVDVIVPNSEFINGRVTNWTFDNENRRIHVPFGAAYGCDKELVREAGLAAAASVEGTVSNATHKSDVWLVGFGDSSLNFELVIWVDEDLVKTPARTQALYLWALETELSARNIEIPFPQRDLHIRSGVLRIANESSDAEPAA